MDMNIELAAVHRRYATQHYFQVYDIAKQIGVFIKRYGGTYTVCGDVGAHKVGTLYQFTVEYYHRAHCAQDEIWYHYRIPLYLNIIIKHPSYFSIVCQELQKIIEEYSR